MEGAPQSHSVISPGFICVMFHTAKCISTVSLCIHRCSPLTPQEGKLCQGRGHGYPPHCTPQCLEHSKRSTYLSKGWRVSLPAWLEPTSWALWTCDRSLWTWRIIFSNAHLPGALWDYICDWQTRPGQWLIPAVCLLRALKFQLWVLSPPHGAQTFLGQQAYC